MKAFVDGITRSAYLPFYLYFGDGNLRMSDWASAADALPEPSKALVHLFLLQKPVKESAIVAVIGKPAIDELVEAKILRREKTQLKTNDFCLISFQSYLYFAQVNSEPWAYFGEDSIALGMYQTPVPGGTVLDLCSGPGIQSLVASRAAKRAVGVEINPDASRVARLNQRMNGIGSHLEFVNFSLEDFARRNTEKFDRILFNPPLVPVPEDLAYPFVGHGGGDGLSVTNHVVEMYLDALTPTGRFEFIGMTVGAREKLGPTDPLMALAKKHRMEGTVHVLSRHRIREDAPLLNASAMTLARSNAMTLETAKARLLQYFEEAEFDHFYLFHCSWGRPQAGKKPKCDVVDMSFYYFGDWFA